jgi:uncharacterized lipoprotein YddW (UPF0748 family)
MQRTVLILLVFVAAAAASDPVQARQAPADPPEIRALWVDAFHDGIRSAREADDLVAAAGAVNLNTLFVQVRRRADALYTQGVEPPLDDPAYDPSFDALAYIVEAGHRAGLQVHAWVNAMPTWRDEAPPRDARHIFNRHGPSAPGDDNWFTASPAGNHRFPVGYFLDPGHPAAAAYLTDIYLNIVRSYEVDGIHFDYIRYPETDERSVRGAGVGYNPVNLRRFRRARGLDATAVPEPGDEAWMAWRRRQVTNLVRRIAIEAKAINPRIKISAALIPWGQPPTSEKNFVDVAPMQRIFQNWHQWMHDGLIDLAVPMNYATETDARVRGWFDGWIGWEKRHRHGRQLAVGLGAYRNTHADTLAQIARVRKPEGGHRVDGVSFFSYAAPQLRPKEPPEPRERQEPAEPAAARLSFLAAAFPRPAPVPPMPWIEKPTTGWIAGVVKAGTPEAVDGVTVKAKRGGFALFRRATRVETDASGYFGLTNVKPGRYRVWVEGGTPIDVMVEAGKVGRAEIGTR